MTISVIIPTYNESKYIKNCLESLSNQTLLPQEIIVIDDGSTDQTLKIVNSMKIKNCKLKIVSQAHRGAGAARNLGAQHATGDILVFLDADMEFDSNFLKNLVAPIIAGTTRGTFSKDEYVKNWHDPQARAWSYCLGLKDDRLIPADYPDTAPVFRAVLKSEFDRVGGFDVSRGYDDDWSLSQKLGYQATATDAVYYHHNPDTYVEIFRQARWRASRKYKLGFIGRLIFGVKTTFTLLRPPYSLAKLFFLTGTKVGLIFPRNRK